MSDRDTSSEARLVRTEALRRLGGPGRVQAAMQMSLEAREISIAGVLHRHPDLDPATARAIVLRRLLGDALYDEAYGKTSPE